MKRLVVLAFIGMLIGVLSMSCSKETITGPTEYEYDTTIMIEYDTIHDTTTITEVVVNAGAAITAIHEDYGPRIGIVEFMPFSSIAAACVLQGWDPRPFGITQTAPNQWHIVGVMYVWAANGYDEGYCYQSDIATYLGGDPDLQSNWTIEHSNVSPMPISSGSSTSKR